MKRLPVPPPAVGFFDSLEDALALAPREYLPAVLGRLEVIKAHLLFRLSSGAPVEVPGPGHLHDGNHEANEIAHLLGHGSTGAEDRSDDPA